MDLALNDEQRFMCHKIQPTNQPTELWNQIPLVVLYQE